MNKRIEQFRQIVPWIVTLILLLSLCMQTVDPASARKVMNAAAVFALLGLLVKWRPLDKAIFWLIAALVAFAAYRMGHTYFMTVDQFAALTEHRYVDSGRRLLIAAMLCYFFAVYAIPRKLIPCFPYAALLALACGLGYTIWQVYHGVDRGQWIILATFYSYNLLCLYVFFRFSLQQWAAAPVWLPVVCFVVAVLAIFLAGTRATMLWLLLLLAVMYLGNWRQVNKHYMVGGIVLLCLAGVIAFPQISARMAVFVADIQRYIDGQVLDTTSGSSMSSRLELWRLAWLSFQQAPLFGAGFTPRLNLAAALAQSGVLDPVVNIYVPNHVHNELFDEASVRGIFGILLLIGLYLSPIKAFRDRWTNNGPLLLMAVFALSGLSDVLFQSRPATVMFSNLMPLMVGLQYLPMIRRK